MWESRGVGEISKRLWERVGSLVLAFHGFQQGRHFLSSFHAVARLAGCSAGAPRCFLIVMLGPRQGRFTTTSDLAALTFSSCSRNWLKGRGTPSGGIAAARACPV